MLVGLNTVRFLGLEVEISIAGLSSVKVEKYFLD
jgi:hypothetical protein